MATSTSLYAVVEGVRDKRSPIEAVDLVPGILIYPVFHIRRREPRLGEKLWREKTSKFMSFKKPGLQDVVVKREFPKSGIRVLQPVKGDESRVKILADSLIEEGLIDATRSSI